MNYIVVAVLTLGGVALLAAVVLYIVSRRFAVKEDPRVKDVQECLPGANCGGCGFAGCAALAEALVKGADKGSLDGLRCPVGGDEAMGKSANYLVRMGTPFAQLVDLCGGLPEGDNKVLAGGPMMGKVVASLEVPVCKGTNAVTVLSGSDAHRGKVQPCIRCGKCVEVCPMGLEPYLLATLSANDMYDRAEQEQIVSCIACGSCQFTCPSHRPILDNIVIGKGRVMANIKSRNQKK